MKWVDWEQKKALSLATLQINDLPQTKTICQSNKKIMSSMQLQ